MGTTTEAIEQLTKLYQQVPLWKLGEHGCVPTAPDLVQIRFQDDALIWVRITQGPYGQNNVPFNERIYKGQILKRNPKLLSESYRKRPDMLPKLNLFKEPAWDWTVQFTYPDIEDFITQH